jgi:Cft2 family RNA processing exonuclease
LDKNRAGDFCREFKWAVDADGEQAQRADYSRQAEENEFAEAIDGVLKRGGSALIPVFAMGKTQEVLAMLQRFKKHGLFFVGYADSATTGGKIRAAKHGDMVELDPAYPPVKLNCEVRVFDFSGHSTCAAIADFAVRVKPKKIFLVHGDDGAMAWFKQELQSRLTDAEIIIPEPGVEFDI